MSIFKSYTPKNLYYSTLRMIDTLFVHPPKLDSNPKSYFRAVLRAHQWIKSDLSDVIAEPVLDNKETTIDQVHASLISLEKMLFGTESSFECSIKGCCIYTEELENRLKTSSSCTIS